MLHAVALFIIGTLVGNEFCIAAFAHPALSRLDDETHRRAARALADVLGRRMPLWYVPAMLLFIAESVATLVPLVWFATLLFFGVIVWTLLRLAPLNKRIASWDLVAPPSDWRLQRARWDSWHRTRVAIIAAAFAMLCVAIGVSHGSV